MGPLQTVSDYAINIIKKLQNENIRSLVPKQEIVSSALRMRLTKLMIGALRPTNSMIMCR